MRIIYYYYNITTHDIIVIIIIAIWWMNKLEIIFQWAPCKVEETVGWRPTKMCRVVIRDYTRDLTINTIPTYTILTVLAFIALP